MARRTRTLRFWAFALVLALLAGCGHTVRRDEITDFTAWLQRQPSVEQADGAIVTEVFKGVRSERFTARVRLAPAASDAEVLALGEALRGRRGAYASLGMVVIAEGDGLTFRLGLTSGADAEVVPLWRAVARALGTIRPTGDAHRYGEFAPHVSTDGVVLPLAREAVPEASRRLAGDAALAAVAGRLPARDGTPPRAAGQLPVTLEAGSVREEFVLGRVAPMVPTGQLLAARDALMAAGVPVRAIAEGSITVGTLTAAQWPDVVDAMADHAPQATLRATLVDVPVAVQVAGVGRDAAGGLPALVRTVPEGFRLTRVALTPDAQGATFGGWMMTVAQMEGLRHLDAWPLSRLVRAYVFTDLTHVTGNPLTLRVGEPFDESLLALPRAVERARAVAPQGARVLLDDTRVRVSWRAGTPREQVRGIFAALRDDWSDRTVMLTQEEGDRLDALTFTTAGRGRRTSQPQPVVVPSDPTAAGQVLDALGWAVDLWDDTAA